MKLVKIEPPGSWCQYEAIMDMLAGVNGRTFIEVGCGSGMLSLRLLERGWTGLGLDFSEAAVEQARTNLSAFIADGRYRLLAGNIFELEPSREKFDVGLSIMVMEHVEDDVGFVRRIAAFVRPGGIVIAGVPGRQDRWGVEDETVGHLRRYERRDLENTLNLAGLTDLVAWSVSVPIANLLFHFSNFFIQRSSELQKKEQSAREQTKASGIREIPGKTLFPAWCKAILNRFTLYPLFVIQRLFYRTDLGLTVIGRGTVRPESEAR
jgi:SAM-dependent methyltransferase